MKITKEKLEHYYFAKKMSVKEMTNVFIRSETCISYWMKKYGIKKRTISESVYLKNNPNGDPFKIRKDLNSELTELKGIGIGLYWGEGNKRNKNSIKIGNTDPALIKKFIEFLVKILGVKRKNIRFSLQVFSDMNSEKAKRYWLEELKVDPAQFSKKITITHSGKVGNYKRKTQYGVLTMYYHNTKLRNILIAMLPL